jgi:hypothetical protein
VTFAAPTPPQTRLGFATEDAKRSLDERTVKGDERTVMGDERTVMGDGDG